MNTSLLRLAATSAIAAACLSACGGGGGGGAPTSVAAQTVTTTPSTPATTAPSTTPPTTTPPTTTPPTTATPPGATPVVQFGSATLNLAAEPGCGYDAVYVTITKIRFHMSATAVPGDAGWTDIDVQPARRINVAQFGNGAISALGTAALLPGHYAQARIVLDQNSSNGTGNSVVVAGSGVETPLLTQFLATDGIAIALGDGFDVVNGQAINVVADFDGCRSVLQNGPSYLLRPVITSLPAVKNGIDGFVDRSLLSANVLVSAQQNGVLVRATRPDPATGEFTLARLTPGNYDLVITADGHAAGVVAGVTVADAVSMVAVNGASTPISLPASPTGQLEALLSLVPASNVEAPFGSALQKFTNGPQVSIRDRMAGLSIGLARFNELPLTRPSLAIWQAGQPLLWTHQAATVQAAGSYLVSSSAPGYVTTGALEIAAH